MRHSSRWNEQQRWDRFILTTEQKRRRSSGSVHSPSIVEFLSACSEMAAVNTNHPITTYAQLYQQQAQLHVRDDEEGHHYAASIITLHSWIATAPIVERHRKRCVIFFCESLTREAKGLGLHDNRRCNWCPGDMRHASSHNRGSTNGSDLGDSLGQSGSCVCQRRDGNGQQSSLGCPVPHSPLVMPAPTRQRHLSA
jgi:hypothetical protein